MRLDAITTESWFLVLPTFQRELWLLAIELWEHELRQQRLDPEVDYGFVVFPAAKAYEGFLKEALFQLGLVSKTQYQREYFRIGKALNPDLPFRYRDEDWVHEKLVMLMGHETVTLLWRAWKEGRNGVFHYDVNSSNRLSLDSAQEKLQLMAEATRAVIDHAVYRRGVQ